MLSALEQPLHPKQKKQVLEAIHTLNLRVTPSQVAEAACLPLPTATQELNRIAAETNAHLEVSDKGNVIYSFSPTFEQSYGLNPGHHCFESACRILVNALLLLAKICFRAATSETARSYCRRYRRKAAGSNRLLYRPRLA